MKSATGSYWSTLPLRLLRRPADDVTAAKYAIRAPAVPAGLLAGLPRAQLVVGRASFYVRLWTPIAKVVQRARGNRRVSPPTDDALPK